MPFLLWLILAVSLWIFPGPKLMKELQMSIHVTPDHHWTTLQAFTREHQSETMSFEKKTPLTTCRWWLSHPFEKYYIVKLDHFPKSGRKFPRIFQKPPLTTWSHSFFWKAKQDFCKEKLMQSLHLLFLKFAFFPHHFHADIPRLNRSWAKWFFNTSKLLKLKENNTPSHNTFY